MTEQAHELPTIDEELERKTFAELENLVNRRELGKITNAEYKASINTLFAICSGLVGKDFFKIISAASEEIPPADHSYLQIRIFQKGDKITIISRVDNGNRFNVNIITCDALSRKVLKGDLEELNVGGETEQKLANFMSNLDKSGFSETITAQV